MASPAQRTPLSPILRPLGGNFIGLLLTSLVSLLLGLGLDAFRGHPLGWHHQPPAEKFAALAEDGQALDSEQLTNLLSQNAVLLLDARPAVFYEMGHLPGALSLSREEFERDFRALEKQLRATSLPLVVYCSDADCEDSLHVVGELGRKGFQNVRLYQGGFSEWEAQGRPVEKSP